MSWRTSLSLLTLLLAAWRGVADADDTGHCLGKVGVGGLGDIHVTGGHVQIDGDRLTLEHNSGISMTSACQEGWDPEGFHLFQLLGRKIAFEVDLSQVGCGCNLALYLIEGPARDAFGQPSRGSCDYSPYYCDANQVCGQWCNEMDIMEANLGAFASTPHRCDPTETPEYQNCDKNGEGRNTRDMQNAYGPGDEFTIDTRRPFEVHTEFHTNTSAQVHQATFVKMVTVLVQGETTLEFASNADAAYLSSMAAAMDKGMVMRLTYWGSDAATMAWLDGPPCGKEVCTGRNAGDAVISNIRVTPLAVPPAGPPPVVVKPPAATPAPAPVKAPPIKPIEPVPHKPTDPVHVTRPDAIKPLPPVPVDVPRRPEAPAPASPSSSSRPSWWLRRLRRGLLLGLASLVMVAVAVAVVVAVAHYQPHYKVMEVKHLLFGVSSVTSACEPKDRRSSGICRISATDSASPTLLETTGPLSPKSPRSGAAPPYLETSGPQGEKSPASPPGSPDSFGSRGPPTPTRGLARQDYVAMALAASTGSPASKLLCEDRYVAKAGDEGAASGEPVLGWRRLQVAVCALGQTLKQLLREQDHPANAFAVFGRHARAPVQNALKVDDVVFAVRGFEAQGRFYGSVAVKAGQRGVVQQLLPTGNGAQGGAGPAVVLRLDGLSGAYMLREHELVYVESEQQASLGRAAATQAAATLARLALVAVSVVLAGVIGAFCIVPEEER